MLTKPLICAPLSALVLAALLAGCSSAPASSPADPTEIPPSTATDVALATQDVPAPVTAESTQAAVVQATAPAVPVFTVAVIADLQSEPVTRAQAEAVIQEAGEFLQALTSISLVMPDFIEDGAGGSTNDMASRYLSTRAGALPNGLVIFSFGDNGQAKSVGAIRLRHRWPKEHP